jgi:hypothetical protein
MINVGTIVKEYGTDKHSIVMAGKDDHGYIACRRIDRFTTSGFELLYIGGSPITELYLEREIAAVNL